MRIFSLFARDPLEVVIGREFVTVNKTSSPASCVTHRIKGNLKLNLEFFPAPELRHWSLTLRDDTPSVPPSAIYTREFQEIDFDQGKALYNKLAKRMASVAGGGGDREGFARIKPWVGGAVLMYAALSVVGLVLSRAPAAPVVAGAAVHEVEHESPVAVQKESQPAAPAPAPSVSLTAKELQKVVGANKIVMGVSGGKSAYLFSDPFCPSCKRLEAAAEEILGKYAITVIPVAFKDGSAELVAKAFCSKNPQAAWRDAINRGYVEGEICEAGVKKAKENRELFLALGFSSTPTLVSSTGVLAVGDAPAQDLAKWVERF